MDRLDQLFARSKREIEAHADELGDTGTGRYFIDEAAQLLSALRLWAQNQYRSDHVFRDMLEAGDVVALREVAHELRQMGTAEAETASALTRMDHRVGQAARGWGRPQRWPFSLRTRARSRRWASRTRGSRALALRQRR